MPSLLDFAASPEKVPNPLPPLNTLRRSGSWPVGLLPLPELAQDLARRGLSYKRGCGFLMAWGEPVDEQEVARLASVTLQIAAESLYQPASRNELLFVQIETLDAEVDRLQMEAHADVDDYEAAEELFAATSLSAAYWANAARRMLDAPGALALDRAGQARGDRFRDHADALTQTARDIKASPAARRLLFQALRAHLPQPEAPSPDEAAAEGFLAALDDRDKLRRSELAALYAAAGTPGNLDLPTLRERAARRWGAPRKFQGIYLWRPAQRLAHA